MTFWFRTKAVCDVLNLLTNVAINQQAFVSAVNLIATGLRLSMHSHNSCYPHGAFPQYHRYFAGYSLQFTVHQATMQVQNIDILHHSKTRITPTFGFRTTLGSVSLLLMGARLVRGPTPIPHGILVEFENSGNSE